MKVILKQKIHGLGMPGDTIDVNPTRAKVLVELEGLANYNDPEKQKAVEKKREVERKKIVETATAKPPEENAKSKNLPDKKSGARKKE